MECMESIKDFVNQFVGEPEKYYTDYSLDHIIRAECTHFLLSAFLGWLGFVLIWTILSDRCLRLPDRYIFHISLLFGCCCSVTGHMFIDAFTRLA